ncbi:protein spire homolog 2 isoform X4 [Lepidochelys kempii]|uniref:protein spire homolog 2 isoform X4 n=1 Tax=Lepidochelys kempii TaxID=8472 RepID=UPI003C705EE1
MAQAGSGGGAAPQERAGGPDPWELSLEEVLKSYEQPINEEQAWAVCYQCCRGLAGAEGRWGPAGRIQGTAGILLHKDGTVTARGEQGSAELPLTLSPSMEAQMVQSLGFAIYRALDWGLDESEERELSPQLEKLIDLMANSDSDDSGCGMADEGYGGQDEEEEAVEGLPRAVRTFGQAMRMCAARLTAPQEALQHYQAVCRALFVETVELKAFLTKIREAKEMLRKLKEQEEELEERSTDELDNLRNTDWARLWVQLMRELRDGVKLKKVQEKQYNPLPTEYQLTPFEMLMQDIRARNYKLRKVMVDGDIPPRVKKDAHERILDFIRSRPPLKQASERRLRPIPQKQRTLHEKILEEIKQERRLRPVEMRQQGQKGFGSLPCILNACASNMKSTSCINLSVPDSSTPAQRLRPRVLLKAPTLAEMEEMNISEEEESPSAEMGREPGLGLPLKRDRSFSEQDLAQFQSERGNSQPDSGYLEPRESELRPRSGSMNTARISMETKGSFPASYHQIPPSAGPLTSDRGSLGALAERSEGGSSSTPDSSSKHLWLICCCCRTKFALFSWPPACLFCKRSVCASCSLKIKMPSKKLAHIPVYALGFENHPGSLNAKAVPLRRRDALYSLHWRRVEEEFPHIYTHGSILKDICSDCTSFVTDVISSSRKSMDILNTTPRKGRKTQSLYIQPTHIAKHQ